MKNLLYVSNSIPYDSIRHAGGKTFNFYVKKMTKECEYSVTVVGLCKESELININDERIIPIVSNGSLKVKIKRIIIDLFGIITFKGSFDNSYYKKKNIIKKLKYLKKNGYSPNIIILEWTNIILMVKYIKKIFPKAKIVASEHDVSFLGAERKYLLEKGLKRFICKRKYKSLKKNEIRSLKLCDIIMPHNIKDKNLLIENGIINDKIFVLTPFFNNLNYIERKNITNDIIFWGAMNRIENFEAAYWFIQNVMPLLSDTDVRFVVVGNNPPKILLDKASEKIIITGFVERFDGFFESGLCFVAPLFKGAGVKVKTIEALSAGIPILTNNIGIEGIPAKDGVSYFHCETANDYEKIIRKLINKEINVEDIKKEQMLIIENEYDLNKAFSNYLKMLNSL